MGGKDEFEMHIVQEGSHRFFGIGNLHMEIGVRKNVIKCFYEFTLSNFLKSFDGGGKTFLLNELAKNLFPQSRKNIFIG